MTDETSTVVNWLTAALSIMASWIAILAKWAISRETDRITKLETFVEGKADREAQQLRRFEAIIESRDGGINIRVDQRLREFNEAISRLEARIDANQREFMRELFIQLRDNGQGR